MANKMVYFFGGGKGEGNAKMKNLLGGKGANLAEMANLGVPVPPGFTITTEVCTYYYENKKKYPKGLTKRSLKQCENRKDYGQEIRRPDRPPSDVRPLRHRSSMPGMMETVLNVGLTTQTIPGLIKKGGNERFVYDAYRRLIMMYSDVVMEKAGVLSRKDDEGIRKQLEKIMHGKEAKGVQNRYGFDAN